MPSSPLHPCSWPGGCPELLPRGRSRCDLHALAAEQQRGSATARGYDYHWSSVFRPAFIARLLALGIAPVCGAALPDGPRMLDSQCRADGIENARHLHLDHDPPLRPEERTHRRTVEDPRRVGLLCRTCHNRKTQREQRAELV